MINLEKIAKNLQKRNMEVFIATTRQSALQQLKKLIPEKSTVAMGGSLSVKEIGGWELLRSGAYTLYDQYKEGISSEESLKIRKLGFSADYYVTGSNAVTEDGILVNIDGFGNRVAAQIYGPNNVILVIGKNKVVPNIEAALDRAQKTAAPLNVKRLKKDTGCAEKGECVDCQSPQRICNFYTIIKRFPAPGRVKVILVNEDLGL